jgi:hypothetical protein
MNLWMVLGAFAGVVPVIAAAQENTASADWLMPGCRALVGGTVESTPFKAGVCAGTISGLAFQGRKIGLCIPTEATPDEGQNSDRLHRQDPS